MQDLKEPHISKEFSNISFFSLPKLTMFPVVEKDAAGNYHFIKQGMGEKIQIIFRIAPVGVFVGKEEEEQCLASILGNEKKITETLLYKYNEPIGILRQKKERWFVENLNRSHCLFGEILTPKNDFICKDNKLYSSYLDELISLILADLTINNNKKCDKQIDFTVWNSSLTAENGLLSAINTSNADKVLFLSPVNKDNFPNEQGPAIVFKDGNYILTEQQRACMLSLGEYDSFFVGKTDRAMEQLDIHLFDKKLYGIYIPFSHFGSIFEEISWRNLKKTQDLLLKSIDVL